MHAGVVERNTAVDVGPGHRHAPGQAEVEDEGVSVDGGLVEAVPLVDVVFGLGIHQARFDQGLQRLPGPFVDGG